MPDFRILIVDDQHEVRRMLHAWMLTLGPRFETLAIPSGEEALLEAARRPVNLLISDVRLPGMTGLELMRKIQKRNPGLKVILITGLTDPIIRKQVAEAGANAFFIKPIEMADFLDAVERCLGVVQSILPEAPILQEPEKPRFDLAGRLMELRRETQARTIAFLEERGEILAQAGDPFNGELDSLLLPSLMSMISSSLKVSFSLGKNPPESLLYFRGSRCNLSIAPVGLSHALLLLTQPSSEDEFPASLGRFVFPACKEILAGLTQPEPDSEKERLAEEIEIHIEIGQPFPGSPSPGPSEKEELVEKGIPTPVEAAAERLEEVVLLEEMPEIDALFNQAPVQNVKNQDLDSFWETAAQQEGNKSSRASALTYEEARRLGLAPEESGV